MLGVEKRVRRSAISVISIVGLTMILTAPGTVYVIQPFDLDLDLLQGSDEGKTVTSFVTTIYVSEGETQHINIPLNDSWLVWSISATVFWADAFVTNTA